MSTFNIEEHKEDIEGYVQLVNDTYDPENGDVYPDMSEFVASVADYLNILHLIREDDAVFDKAWNSIADVISQVSNARWGHQTNCERG